MIHCLIYYRVENIVSMSQSTQSLMAKNEIFFVYCIWQHWKRRQRSNGENKRQKSVQEKLANSKERNSAV